jgi:hypothetical protein
MNKSGESDDPRRRVLIQALTLGLFALPAAARAQIFGSTPKKLPDTQSFYKISGDVRVNGEPATLQTRVQSGDRVETGPNSEAIFIVGTQSMILRANAHLEIQSPDDKVKSFLVGGLRVLQGALLSVSRDSRMQIVTPTATVGIRGTGFYIDANPDQTYFCTCYGITDIAANNDSESKDSVTATHHDRPLYIVKDGSPGKNIRPAPFINHTDQELMLIETLVGRTPPFVFPGTQYGAPRRDY